MVNQPTRSSLFERVGEDGKVTPYPERLDLFRNTDKYGNPLARPRTLLIDSEQLESGDALDKTFCAEASEEIERFRQDLVQRSGDQAAGQNISEQDLLREVMNTVGKEGQLGESIRCVVSVSMLTEGWDANTVTHVLGMRAFGTQLLCEQVIGRALRRQSYDINEEGKFNVEYADVLGIPFDFTAKPVIAKPVPPRQTVHVKAVCPDRDHLEIQFTRVDGYRVELPDTRLTAKFSANSVLELPPAMVGPSATRNKGIIGEGVDLNHANWVVCNSDWESEFCRVAEAHPRVRAYVKNHNLGLEVPYRLGSTPKKYLPDFIVQVDDGRDDPLNLIVELKGYRGEDAKVKADTMLRYWVSGVNNLDSYSRWAFAEFTEVFEIESDFSKLVETGFDQLIGNTVNEAGNGDQPQSG
ncbi:restriction endonuclease [Leptolyngbya sp. Heron Island J]|uniref:restriction endonuclease n=1 Tax=Leptolyngbya sp. Heron Island J TaxID=1385935 RepID=UPI0003B9859C|nr:restriction endonuclease [Leptolyngbya sp. Heron Island J]ESA38781.1 restriction endonuclease [Leptolyngbya sp. Heron Island J]